MRLVGCEQMRLSVETGLRKNEKMLELIFFFPVPTRYLGSSSQKIWKQLREVDFSAQVSKGGRAEISLNNCYQQNLG